MAELTANNGGDESSRRHERELAAFASAVQAQLEQVRAQVEITKIQADVRAREIAAAERQATETAAHMKEVKIVEAKAGEGSHRRQLIAGVIVVALLLSFAGYGIANHSTEFLTELTKTVLSYAGTFLGGGGAGYYLANRKKD